MRDEDGKGSSDTAGPGRPSGDSKGSGNSGSAPKSVREGMALPTHTPPEIEVAERTLEVDGTTWTVSEAGRAGAGTSERTVVPLLLLVYRTEGRDPLESMIPGGTLEEVSEEALRTGLERARPWREPDERRPFFRGTRGRSGS